MTEENYYPSMQTGYMYHIYNRGNNRENIFYHAKNYNFFLLRLQKYLSPYLRFYSYCLIPNHFHLLTCVKNENELPISSKLTNNAESSGIHLNISEVFRRFFMSYAKAINKQEGRRGSLFQKNFKRKWISSKEDALAVILYFHTNPAHHKLRDDFKQYPYSSYNYILHELNPWLMTDEVIQLFGGKEEYCRMHEQYAAQMMNLSKSYIWENE